MTQTAIPEKIQAVFLTGPKTLVLEKAKPVVRPGAHQLLCKVEVVGLCFSDLKLLNQFSEHVRKSEIITTLTPETLAEVPSYAPGEKPTVPGHELVVTVVEAGPETKTPVGLRALVQTDYRWLKTAASNAAFGYNFEGGLQEYVLMDERVIISPEGESMLIPVDDKRAKSAVALVEPWACVEDSYVWIERATAKAGGRMLIAADAGCEPKGVAATFSPEGAPAEILMMGVDSLDAAGAKVTKIDSLEGIEAGSVDDVIYFGADKATAEALDPLLGKGGLMNVVQCGKKFGEPVSIGIGRVHYGGIRFIGTTGCDAAESLATVPATPEIREGDKVMVTGAAGPMGVMHVVRNLCQGVSGVEVVATDFSDERLAALDKIAAPLAEKNGLKYRSFNPQNNPEAYEASYAVVMVPVPALAAGAIKSSGQKAIINVFAGIPATVWHEADLDVYIERKQYFVGTSGSNLEDMRIVLGKVLEGSLDTNISVAAVTGMAGAVEGIAAVENRTIAGKILVYPMLHDLPLTTLDELKDKYPSVYAKLDGGVWTKEAEAELLAVAQ